MSSQYKKLGIKVAAPRAKPKGSSLFPAMRPPQNPGKRIKKKIYTKGILNQDPSDFFNIGFGNTGLTGES